MSRDVAIVIYDGVELLDFAGPAEVFAVAGDLARHDGVPAFRVHTVAPTKEPIVSQGFLKVVPDHSIDSAPQAGLVVIPGGDASRMIDDPRLFAWITAAAQRAELALTVCTGAVVLGKAGLLDGCAVTTWHGAFDKLRAAAPRADVQEGRRFIDAGRIVTTAGVSAGIDGALYVVQRLAGRALAEATARYMEYRWVE